jgi:ABC-type sugar transport system ATPase subunit
MRLGIRAEHVRLLALDDADPASLVGDVSLIESLGADTFIEVTAGAAAVTCWIEPELSVRLGDRVRVGLPAARLHLFEAQIGDSIN